MASLPTTPSGETDSNHPSMQVSDEDDFPPNQERTFYIVNMAGDKMTLKFDDFTSVGWAWRQAVSNPDWAKSEAAPCEKRDVLFRGKHKLTRFHVKVYEIFDGYEEESRILTFVKYYVENDERRDKKARIGSA